MTRQNSSLLDKLQPYLTLKNYILVGVATLGTLYGINHFSKDDNDGSNVFMYKQQLAKTRLDDVVFDNATYVHPMFWDVKNNKIKNNDQEEDMQAYVKKAHEKGVKVLPGFFAQGKEGINAMNNASKYAKEIANKVEAVGADGILIDIESSNYDSNQSEDLINFLKQTRKELKKINKKYQIGVAVAAKYEGSEKKYRYHGFYDLKQINDEVDFVQFMAYNFNSHNPGSSLPNEKLELIVKYAKDKLDDEKIVIILPFYGRLYDHNGNPTPGTSYNVVGARNNKNYSSKAEEIKYEDGDLRIKTKNRILYTQDKKTIEDRVELLEKLGITNVGAWQQTQGTEEMIKALNNN